MYEYFTVVIPYVAKGATKWHPTDSVGPFSTLTRGAFACEETAHLWALINIPGHTYSVRQCESPVPV